MSDKNPEKQTGQQWSVLSPKEIEYAIECIEKEYGVIDANMKKTIREEVAGAVPELTKALMPIVESLNQGTENSAEAHQNLIRAFMQVMLPHMQKIANSAQQ